MKSRILILLGIILTVAIGGTAYTTNFENADADDINKGIGITDVWEPGPTDGFTPTEIPLQKYQDANERSSYADALSNGSIVIASVSPELSDKQLDDVMDKLLYSEFDRFILPIASIAIDYETGTLVLWTPDLSIGNKVKTVVGDTSFVLLYEEAPPRWEHDGPEPEPEPISESEPQGIFDSHMQYTNYQSTCNDVIGQPNAECFVKSFENCNSATIKHRVNTVEGDPVFFYAAVIPNDPCEIHFEIDDRLDKFGGGNFGKIKSCSDVKLTQNHLDFYCHDDWYGFPLH